MELCSPRENTDSQSPRYFSLRWPKRVLPVVWAATLMCSGHVLLPNIAIAIVSSFNYSIPPFHSVHFYRFTHENVLIFSCTKSIPALHEWNIRKRFRTRSTYTLVGSLVPKVSAVAEMRCQNNPITCDFRRLKRPKGPQEYG